MSAVINISWNGDEGKIKTTPAYDKLYDIARLDCLKDVLFDLTQLYNKELEKFHTDFPKKKLTKKK